MYADATSNHATLQACKPNLPLQQINSCVHVLAMSDACKIGRQVSVLPWLARNAQHDVNSVAAISQKLLQLKVDTQLYQAPAHLHRNKMVFGQTCCNVATYISRHILHSQTHCRQWVHFALVSLLLRLGTVNEKYLSSKGKCAVVLSVQPEQEMLSNITTINTDPLATP